MDRDTRIQQVNEIIDLAKQNNLTLTTFIIVVAQMNDEVFKKFYLEFKENYGNYIK